MEQLLVSREPVCKEEFEMLAQSANFGLLKLTCTDQPKTYYANDCFFQIIGFSKEEFESSLSCDLNACIYPEDLPMVKAVTAKQSAMSDTVRFECRIQKKDHSIAFVKVTLIHRIINNVQIFLYSLSDITQARLAIIAANKSKHTLDIFANSVPGGLVKIDAKDYKFLYANDGFFRLSDLSRYEYYETYENQCIRLVHPDDVAFFHERCQKAIKNNFSLSFEYRIVRKNGEIRWSYLNGVVMTEEESNSPCIFCVIMDITEQKENLTSLNLWRQRALYITQLIGENLWEYDIATDQLTRYGDLSKTYSESSLIENYRAFILSNQIVHPDDLPAYDKFFNDLTHVRKSMRLEIRMKNHLGIYTWIKINGLSMLDSSHKTFKILGKVIEAEENKETLEENIYPQFNEAYLSDAIHEAIEEKSDTNPFGLILLSLDQNHELREFYGDKYCDSLMEDGLNLLQENLESASICEWLQNDSFVIFIPSLEQETELVSSAIEYKKALNRIYTGNSMDSFTFSAGLSVSFPSEDSFELLYKRAELALFTAQSKGLNGLELHGRKIIPPFRQINEETKVASNLLTFGDSFKLAENAISLINSTTSNRNKIFSSLLSRLSKMFHADCAFLAQIIHSEQTFRITNRWQAPGIRTDNHYLLNFPLDDIRHLPELFNEQHIFTCNHLAALMQASPLFAEGIRLMGVSSALLFAIYEGNQFEGVLCVGFKDPDHIFRWKRIGAFMLIGKIIEGVFSNHNKPPYDNFTKFDPVTGLYNFSYFIKEANALIKKNKDGNFALVYCDINKFRFYNENYGFVVGNKVLRKFASSISGALYKEEIAARIEKDHFIVLVRFKTESELLERLNQTLGLLNEQSPVKDYYRFDSSYGVYLLKKEELDVTYVIDHANTARKYVKRFSGNHYAIFTEELAKGENDLLKLSSEFARALKNREFVPYFRPQYDLDSEQVISARICAKWLHPQGQVIALEDILPYLPDRDEVADIEFQVLKAGCRHLRKCLDKGIKVYRLFFPLSLCHFMNDCFVDRLKQIMEKYRISVKYLGVEIEEEFFIRYPNELRFLLPELRRMGIVVIMGNFGDCYSSLNLLRDFDVDGISVNIGFIRTKGDNKRDYLILSKMIEMAKGLDLMVYAKGVENLYQHDFLKEAGCDIAQGDLFCKELAVGEYEGQF